MNANANDIKKNNLSYDLTPLLIDKYQNWTESTAIYPKANEEKYLLYGLTAELGEFMGKLAKAYRGDKVMGDEDIEGLKKELGDIMWFAVRIAGMYGWKMSDVLESNVAKLNSRKERNTLKGNGDNR